VNELLERWKRDLRQVRERMDRAPTPRERARWPALWLVARGWSAARVAEALERDPHAGGEWLAEVGRGGPPARACEQTGGSPPPATGRRRPT
jgi:hypothetical protein